MPLIDAHCHLQADDLWVGLDSHLKWAGNTQVRGYCCCGTSSKDWERVQLAAQKHYWVVPFFGLHPQHVNERAEDWFERLSEYVVRNRCGIGEIGLDHVQPDRDDQAQEEAFILQLKLAKFRRIPVNVHCRSAWQRLPTLLEEHFLPEIGVILHSYSGGAELIPHLIKLGAYFSFSGSLTWPNNHKGHRALQAVPLDRLLLETDAPDIPLAIHQARGQRNPNEPADLIEVLERAAELREMNPVELARITYNNSRKVLGKLWIEIDKET